MPDPETPPPATPSATSGGSARTSEPIDVPPKRPGSTTRVGVIGAGFIATAHLDALARTPNVQITAVCDASPARAAKLGRQTGAQVFSSVAELARSGHVDAVHILTPPGSHGAIIQECIGANLHVLCEKPLCLDPEEAAQLARLAQAKNVLLAVNHNLACHPLVERVVRDLSPARLGQLEHVELLHHVPLRQLETGDVGHFMFQTDANILFEQGVHPFSIAERLVGPAVSLEVRGFEPQELPSGVVFRKRWSIDWTGPRGTARILLAFGRTMPEQRLLAIGTDGTVEADLARGSYRRTFKSRWLDPLDRGLNGVSAGLRLLWQGLMEPVNYTRALLRLGSDADPYLASMRAAIGAFHDAVRFGTSSNLALSAEHGVAVLEAVVLAAEQVGARRTRPPAAVVPDAGDPRDGEVVVTGGTGFVGRRVVRDLLAMGKPVTMIVRDPSRMAASVRESVRIVVGDAGDPAVLGAACRGADCVIHLATCAGDDPAEAMPRAAEALRDACRDAGVRRLVFASSTAALNLGAGGVLADPVEADSSAGLRPPYAQGKIFAERELIKGAGDSSTGDPELVILRPGVVIGPDGNPQHTGVGLWPRDNHCLGWSMGKDPLPLILVEDCARAFVLAVDAPEAAGKAFNLAGDVQLTAREYVRELASVTGRPLRYHGQPTRMLWLVEQLKVGIKKLARRSSQPVNMHDLRSRAFKTRLDCSAAKQALGWMPEGDRGRFVQRAFVGEVGAAPVAEQTEMAAGR